MLMVSGFYLADDSSVNSPFRWDGKGKSSDRRPRERRRVLVVDDETLIADTLAEILNDSGFEAMTAYSADSALEVIQSFEPDILMSDVLMPRQNGVELAITVRSMRPETKILLFSGQPSTGSILQNARKQGHDFEVLGKPVMPEQLISKLKAM
jgi:DNA-binding NtrC family response regulator